MRFFSKRFALTTLAIGLLIPFVIYVIGAVYIRYIADDYCEINLGHQYGAFGAALYNYQNWTGRFTGGFTRITVLLAGLPAATVIMILVLFVWWISISAVFLKIAHHYQWAYPRLVAALGTSLLTLATLNSAFNVMQSVFWIGAIFLYFVPIILLSIFAWLIVQQPAKSRGVRILVISLCAITAFVAAGFTEIWGVMQMVGLALTCLFCIKRRELHHWLPGLLAGLVGGSIALIITIAAPGNFVRLSYNAKPDLLYAIVGTLVSPAVVARVTLTFSPVTTLALIVIPAVLAFCGKRTPEEQLASDESQFVDRSKWYLLLIPVVVWLLIMSSFALPFFATANPPPERAWIMPQFILCCALMMWGFVLGTHLRRSNPANLIPSILATAQFGLAVTCALVIIVSISRANNTVDALATQAAAWDKRESQIVLYMNQPIWLSLAPIPNYMLLDPVSYDKTVWVNICMASYYRVATITQDDAQIETVVVKP